jgi:hypothetical protein
VRPETSGKNTASKGLNQLPGRGKDGCNRKFGRQ